PPTAGGPNNVSVDTASARPRTHSAAPRWAARIRLDTTTSQPAPAMTIAPSNRPKLVTHASARHPKANTAVASAVIASVDQRRRQPGRSAAPSSPPRPRQPTRAPYEMAPRPNTIFATSGSSAQSALANSTNAAVRTMTVRSAGVYRTYLMPARTADAMRSAGSVARRDSRRHRHRTTNTPTTDAALMRNTGPGPPATMITPAIAGPTARATLIATVPSPTLAGSSSRGTTSGIIACHAGMSTALPAPMASVIARSIHGCTTPVTVSTPSSAAIRNNQTWATSKTRRRSRISARAPPGRARRNSGMVVAACTSETISGEGASNVINQAAAESCIHVPMLDTTSEIHRARNNGRRSGLQAVIGVAVISGSLFPSCRSLSVTSRTLTAPSTHGDYLLDSGFAQVWAERLIMELPCASA